VFHSGFQTHYLVPKVQRLQLHFSIGKVQLVDFRYELNLDDALDLLVRLSEHRRLMLLPVYWQQMKSSVAGHLALCFDCIRWVSIVDLLCDRLGDSGS
jgi:hypothetical protein